jgi:hypothetical protein
MDFSMEHYLLTADNQFVLNNYSQNLVLFPKASTDLQVIRLGDSTVFNKITLKVDSLTEFKTSNKVINFSKIDSIFDDKFKKSPLLNHQLLDFNKRILYHRGLGDSFVKYYDLTNFHADNFSLTEKFKLGRNISTQRPGQSTLQFNSVTSALSNFFKIIKY